MSGCLEGSVGAQEAFLEGVRGVEVDGLVSLTKEELLCVYQKIVRAKTFLQNCELNETGVLSSHLQVTRPSLY